MPEQLLTILKFCLLALVYLFFLRIVRVVWLETMEPTALAARALERVDPGRRRERRQARVDESTHHPQLVAPAEPSGPTSLHVVAAPTPTSFPLGSTVLIGRSSDCQITIDESFVSSFHAQVRTTPDGVIVDDLGSTNGTFVNRQRISGPTFVSIGDVVGVGNVELELR